MNTIVGFDDYEFDAERLELRRAGTPMRADRMVLRLLGVLVATPGQLVTKDELMERVWDRRAVSENVISVSIARLRKTLGHKQGEREYVVSVQGRGYRFVRAVTVHEPPAVDPTTVSANEGCTLVGREPVIARLKSALAAARQGRGSLCLLTGEPGIGKTAAAEQLAACASASGLPVVWAYCQEVGETPPLWPFVQLLRGVLRAQPAALGEPPAPELAFLLPERAREPTAPAEQRAKHRIFEAVLGVLERAAASAPCVLAIDDLHRADAASLELLRYWMDRLAHTRVLVVATLRSLRSLRTLAGVDLSFVVGHRNCTRIPLERLDAAAVEAYVLSILPDRDRTLAHAVWAKSEGNPFFMVELARQLADAQHAAPDSLRVSDEALALLRPRVVELDGAAQGLLSCAAVIGRRFELRLLQKIADVERDTVAALLDAAVASDVVIPAAEAGTAFAFGHELIRKLLYDALAPGARRKLHLKVGKTLEQLVAEGEVVPAAVLAYHFHAALPDSDPVATLNLCQRAALEATQLFAHEDSIRYLRRALEALSLYERPNPMARLLLLFQQAVSARIAGVPAFEQLLYEAADVARAIRSGPFLIEVAMLLHLHPGFPTPPGARALLEEGLAMLPEDETSARAAALARLATCGPVAFDAARSKAQLDRALSLVQRGAGPIPRYNVHAAAHYLHGSLDADGAATAGPLERLFRETPGMLRIAPALLDLHAAIVAHQRAQLDEARDALDRFATRSREMGVREFGWHAERYRLLSRLQVTKVDEIAAELRALHERAARESIVGNEVMSAFDAIVVLGDVHDPAELRRVLAYSPDDPPSIWSVKAQTLAAAGLVDDAERALGAVPADALKALPHDRDYLGTLGAAARAAVALGSHDRMEALYQLLSPYADGLVVHVSFLCLGPASLLRGELASALGLRADALSHFSAALEIAERLRLPMFAEAARTAIAALRPAPVPKSEALCEVAEARRPIVGRPQTARTTPG